jgi:hypothetical protein
VLLFSHDDPSLNAFYCLSLKISQLVVVLLFSHDDPTLNAFYFSLPIAVGREIPMCCTLLSFVDASGTS